MAWMMDYSVIIITTTAIVIVIITTTVIVIVIVIVIAGCFSIFYSLFPCCISSRA
jgi:hypothetical protein